jgi:EpsI family protein
MSKTHRFRIVILIVALLLTSGLIFHRPASEPKPKPFPLPKILNNVNGWKVAGQFPMEEKIVRALELDDYVFAGFANGQDRVGLYIGYYLTTKKVGAAHDPLVCFPGQGWVLSDKSTGKLSVGPEGKDVVSYSSMVANKGKDRELLVYWFQSYDETSGGTFSQKLRSLAVKFRGGGEDNAFVRVSTELGEQSQEQAREIIFRFVRDFYPVFLTYIRQ